MAQILSKLGGKKNLIKIFKTLHRSAVPTAELGVCNIKFHTANPDGII